MMRFARFKATRAAAAILFLLCAVAPLALSGADDVLNAPAGADAADAPQWLQVTTLLRADKGAASLKRPTGVAVARSGHVYVADAGEHAIFIVAPDGAVQKIGSGKPGHFDGAGAAAAFKWPSGIAVDDERGVAYVADTGNHVIRVISSSGQVTTLAGSGTPGDRDGAGVAARFHQPAGLALGANGTLFVADSGNHKIRAVSPDGAVATVAGRGTPGFADGAAAQALFHAPQGVAIGGDAFYVADTKNHRIRRIANGVVTTIAGAGQPGRADGPSALAMFDEPSGVAVLSDGTIIIADTKNHQLRAVANGIVSTVSGTGKPGYVDGTDLARAQFAEPNGLAAAGFLVIADAKNSAVRQLIAAFHVSQVEPQRGPVAGGNEVVIRGAGFTPSTTVRFGTSAATTVTFASPGELRAVVPTGAASGPVDVTVSDGSRSQTLDGAYTYLVPPSVASVEPRKGATAGGEAVTVYGSDFAPQDTTVKFGSSDASNVNVGSPNSLTTTTPPHAAGAVDVEVVTSAGRATATSAYTYMAPPSITAFAPAAGRAGTTVVINGANFDEVRAGNTVRFGAIPGNVVAASPSELAVIAPASVVSAPISVTTAGGTATSSVAFDVLTYTALEVGPVAVTLSPGETTEITATATTPDGQRVDVTTQATWTSSAPDHVSVTTGHLTALADGTATITARIAGLSASATVTVASEPLPRDPAELAPEPDPTIVAPLADRVRFLYTGSDAIQRNVAAEVITDERVTVIRGKVRQRGGRALPGVRVTVLHHPEYGYTLTRADGAYDLAVNGGGPVALRMTKGGYIAADRLVVTQWNQQLVAPDVALVPYDANVTVIAGGAAIAQVARGGAVTDEDGTRRATLYVPAQTNAALVMPDGSTQPAAELHVRASEFSVGADGLRAMPAPLPPSSAYTYCVELSADEAATSGASEVRFSKPLSLYVENFLSFPVGTAVPLGYYDRVRGAWIGAENGRVLKILAIANGSAAIDSDGDAQADSEEMLAGLGIDGSERATLATLYTAGQTLWRARVEHFTPWDANWPFGPPTGATGPRDAEAYWIPGASSDGDPNGQACGWSTIDCKNQILSESIPIVGTPFSLEYNSGRVAKTQYKMTVRATGATVHPELKRVELRITVGGRSFEATYTPGTNLEETFTWDGVDAYGKSVQGATTAAINVSYVYPAIYAVPAEAEMSWAMPGRAIIAGARRRAEVTLGRSLTVSLGRFGTADTGFGDWSLSAQAFYDGNGRVIYEGSTQRGGDPRGTGDVALYTIAGNGGCCDTGEGGPARDAQLEFPISMAMASDGTMYFVDTYKIKKVDTNGIVTTIAGTSSSGFTPDGQPALGNRIWPWDIAVGPDDIVYFNDIQNARVRRIVNGVLETVAGNGQFSGDAPDGAPAASVPVNAAGIAIGPDGTLYIAAGDVQMVGRDGILRTLIRDDDNGTINADRIAVANDATVYVTGGFRRNLHRITPDGTATLIANNLRAPQGLAVAPDGTVLVTERDGHDVKAFGPNGAVSTFAGNGLRTTSMDGALSRSTPTSFPMDARIAPDGGVLLAMSGENKIRRTRPIFPAPSKAQTIVPSADGSIAYVFVAGRHVRTVDTLTGVTLLTLAYDHRGRLTRVTDADANVTTIERDGEGNATAIVAPGGQRTGLTKRSGKLTQIVNPANEAHDFTYNAAGLLATLIDPRRETHKFTYDGDGLLIKDEDPVGGFIALGRSGRGRNYTITRTSAEGRTQSYTMGVTTDNAATRVHTGTDGLQQSWSKLGASTTVQHPDGTRIVVAHTSDTRFGFAAPQLSSVTATLPSGLAASLSATSTAVLADKDDPLSLVSLTADTIVNGRKVSSTYVRATNTVTVTSAASRLTIIKLDEHGRTSEFRRGTLAPTTYTYTAAGKIKSVTSGNRTYTFDDDAQQRLSSITDPLTRQMRFSYDDAGRVATQTLLDGRVVAYTYDADGNVTSVTPPLRPTHSLTWTPIGMLSSYVPPGDGGRSQYEYDRDRRLRLVTRPDGSTLHTEYDADGRVAAVVTPQQTIRWAYVATNGAVARAESDLGGAIAYTYDGPMVKSATWTGAVAGSISLEYDNSLRVISETAAGWPITFAYDADDLLVRAGALTLSPDSATGLLTGTEVGSITDQWGYNEFGEAVSYTARFGTAPIAEFTYTRDDTGRIQRLTSTAAGVTSVSQYAYDSHGRLIQAVNDGVTTNYDYDANGNRTARRHGESATNGTYDSQDRLIAYGASTYGYNRNGELTEKNDANGRTTYEYTDFGDLRKVILPSGRVIEYVIDAQNRRVGRKVDGTLTNGWLYAGQLRIVAELDDTGAVVSRFVYGSRANVPDYMIREGATFRIISDHLGSPRMVVNAASGALVQAIVYDEFGNVLSDTNPGFQPFGFAGGLYDRETGLTRFGARDYDPHTGRWTTKDPIGFSGGGTNLYEYVSSSPVNIIDPAGLSGKLTIYSSYGGGSSGPALYDSHSWIVFTPDGGAPTSYGTYGVMVQAPRGLNVNWELDHWSEYGDRTKYSVFSRTAWINDAQEAALMATIERYRRLGDDAWTSDRTCSTFARDAWRSATGESLEIQTKGDNFANPITLSRAIRKANNGLDSRVLWRQK